ncbi:MAG: protein-L-isoaspartate O-methyltransferase [Alphaproteobacteria bacterium]|nr:protein-L-isoaspartate O-methyltransferase [Alphaproteobacteria bacterium]|tara:strand:- start:2783 stop:3457 length:675 start_codon:yes stop_codon:yes gene_type:complete
MSEPEQISYDDMRRQMMEIISLHALVASEVTGKHELDDIVMGAMANVPRHEFVPVEMRDTAYVDSPLPIGHGKTISQPFMCALMTDLLELEINDKVLEVGTGLGYGAAVLSQIADQVFSVEILSELAEEAQRRLRAQDFDVQTRIGDGSYGWPDEAPFDKIIVTAAPEVVPQVLLEQLKPGGRMVIPAGSEDSQTLKLVEKEFDDSVAVTEIMPVVFAGLVLSH